MIIFTTDQRMPFELFFSDTKDRREGSLEIQRQGAVETGNREQTVDQSLLTPTRINVKLQFKLVEKDLVRGMTHITGGGL